MEELKCPECGIIMEQVDTTYSNTETDRAKIGQLTGIIYLCTGCEGHYIDNKLIGNIEKWTY